MLGKPPYAAYEFAMRKDALKFCLRPFEEVILIADVKAVFNDFEKLGTFGTGQAYC